MREIVTAPASPAEYVAVVVVGVGDGVRVGVPAGAVDVAVGGPGVDVGVLEAGGSGVVVRPGSVVGVFAGLVLVGVGVVVAVAPAGAVGVFAGRVESTVPVAVVPGRGVSLGSGVDVVEGDCPPVAVVDEGVPGLAMEVGGTWWVIPAVNVAVVDGLPLLTGVLMVVGLGVPPATGLSPPCGEGTKLATMLRVRSNVFLAASMGFSPASAAPPEPAREIANAPAAIRCTRPRGCGPKPAHSANHARNLSRRPRLTFSSKRAIMRWRAASPGAGGESSWMRRVSLASAANSKSAVACDTRPSRMSSKSSCWLESLAGGIRFSVGVCLDWEVAAGHHLVDL